MVARATVIGVTVIDSTVVSWTVIGGTVVGGTVVSGSVVGGTVISGTVIGGMEIAPVGPPRRELSAMRFASLPRKRSTQPEPARIQVQTNQTSPV